MNLLRDLFKEENKVMIPLGLVVILIGISSKSSKVEAQVVEHEQRILAVENREQNYLKVAQEISERLARIEGALHSRRGEQNGH